MNPLTPKALAVAEREFMQRVKTKWFILSTIGLPVVMVAVGLGIVLMKRGAEDSERGKTIGVVDPAGVVAKLLVEELNEESLSASRAADMDSLPTATARERFRSTAYDYLVILSPGAGVSEGEIHSPNRKEPPEEKGKDGRADVADQRVTTTLLTRDNVPMATQSAVRNALQRALLRIRLQSAGVEGVDAADLLRRPRLNTSNVTETGETRSQRFQGVASMAIAWIFYMTLLINGQMVLMATIEDKQSGIVEILASSLRPWELMLGKILGCGAVVLAQMTIWALMVTLPAAYFLTVGAGELAGFDLVPTSVAWGAIALALLFLLLGYLLYTAVFAGAGATASDMHDAQQVAMPIILPSMIPLMAAPLLVDSPNDGWTVILSLIPIFSPVMMPSRLFATVVPFWQWGLSLVLLTACALGTAWVAGRIYRVGILMKGQRPSLPELVRWIRHG